MGVKTKAVAAAALFSTMIAGITGAVQAQPQDEQTLQEQAAGDTVQFAGSQWILLDPEEGLLIRRFSAGNRQWNSSDSGSYNASSIRSYLEGSFYNSIDEPYQSRIEERTFPSDTENIEGIESETNAKEARVSLLTVSQMQEYQDFINFSTPFTWLRNYNQGSAVTFSNNQGIRYIYVAKSDSLPVHPVLHVDDETFVDTNDNNTLIFENDEPVDISITPNGSDWTTSVEADVEVEAAFSGVDPQSLQFAWAPEEETPEEADFAPFTSGESVSLPENLTASGPYVLHVRAADYWNNEVSDTSDVFFYDGTSPDSPHIELQADSDVPTQENITIHAAIDAEDLTLEQQAWGAGSLETDDFADGAGEVLEDSSFTVEENGTYTVFAQDEAGNTSVEEIDIDLIDREAPSLTFALSPDTPTKDSVDVLVDADGNGSAIDTLLWADDTNSAEDIQTIGTNFEDRFTVEENGTFIVYAKDEAGNETVEDIDVTNLVLDPPTITTTLEPNTLTNQPVDILVDTNVQREAAGNQLETSAWAAGSYTAEDFPADSTAFTESFVVDANGTYTILIEDLAGHQVTKQVPVSSIWQESPDIAFDVTPAAPTSDPVTIDVTAVPDGEAEGNTIDQLLWAEGEQQTADMPAQGEDISQAQAFTVTENDTYTVYARDALGNEGTASITIDHILDSDAALQALKLEVDGEPLHFDPAFDAETDAYSARVSHRIRSVDVLPVPSSDTATVNINDEPHEDRTSVDLATGTNTIDVTVQAEDTDIEQTYSISLTRRASPRQPEPEEAAFAPTFTWTQGDEHIELPIEVEIESLPDGRTGASVTFTAAQLADVLASLDKADRGDFVFSLPEEVYEEADEWQIAFSEEAAVLLQDTGQTFVLDTPDARLALPPLPDGEEPEALSFLIDTLQEDAVDTLTTRVETSDIVEEAASGEAVRVIGSPVRIETEHADRPTQLIFPVDADADDLAEVLASTGVYIERDDGTTFHEAQRYEDENGDLLGIGLDVDAFSTFALVEVDPTTLTYEAYMEGFEDHTFRPEHASKRAEIAKMLAATVDHDAAAPSYPDLSSDHWAAAAIGTVTAEGWMEGDPTGFFRPEQDVTRAEMAAIAVRKAGIESQTNEAAFADTTGHWGQEAIATAESAGLLIGYADGTFRPDQTITRAEAVTIMNRVYDRPAFPSTDSPWQDVSAGHWAFDAIHSASADFQTEKPLFGEEVLRNEE
ncbi:S-layer homology domain-containing protein [Alkalicoccus chagannorensis]|uniref:S-layer homology domain-containing protein n=1 Tax=Alkalicoccus chagannorensis TaxID=427072 RepID=UPI0003F56DF2|nr:S-layer homology domain-containing protein [Alkalicoccus chagannorensis]